VNTLRAVLVLALLAAPALAADDGEAKKQEAAAQLLFFMLFPLVTMLLALPAAAVYRSTVAFPAKVAATLEARPVVCRLLGVGNLVLVALVLAGAAGNPVIGVIGLLLSVALALGVLVGLTAAAGSLARRFLPGREPGLGGFLLGWLFLAGVSLLPYLGFLYHLWFAAGGLGATLLSLLPARKVPG